MYTGWGKKGLSFLHCGCHQASGIHTLRALWHVWLRIVDTSSAAREAFSYLPAGFISLNLAHSGRWHVRFCFDPRFVLGDPTKKWSVICEAGLISL